MERKVLQALTRGAALSLADEASANTAAAQLQSAIGGPLVTVTPGVDSLTETRLLRVVRKVHGVERVTILDQDFLDSGDYSQIRHTADLVQGLLGEGAVVRRGDDQHPVTDFREALDWLLDQVRKGVSIQRYKGLGEMNPEQLWETTMDPASRTLLRAQVEDSIAADEIFSTLMGDIVEPRRAFIESNALGVRNLDV
jgi:DNA gyrase subunit B